MYYVYLNKDATEPVKFETEKAASDFVTNQEQPTLTRIFTEETHAKFLRKRELQVTRPARISELMAENSCSRVWAYELYRREQGGVPKTFRRRGPKLSAQRLEAKIADLEARAAEYRRQLAEVEAVRTESQARTGDSGLKGVS
jgi:AAA+ ATPase superfamily predicted ATPase